MRVSSLYKVQRVHTTNTHMEKYYQSPFSGEQWTKEEHDAYVQWEETRIAENKKNDCDDCYGCERCESM